MSDTDHTPSPDSDATEGQDAQNSEVQTPEVEVPETSETPEVEVEVEVDAQHLRLLEAVLFAALEPLTEDAISQRLPNGTPVIAALARLQEVYANRGVNLIKAGERWFFRTAEDLSEQLRVHMKVPRRLSRAAMETLAIIAYHQPVTRAEIEEIRGVGLSKGTLDALFEASWIGPKGRRRTAGRPVTWGTTNGFLTTFGIDAIGDLPGLDDLKAAGLLDKRPAIQITDTQEVDEDENDPLDDEEPLEMDLLDDEVSEETPQDGQGDATPDSSDDTGRQP
jgi:segregation and condensation protein B